MFIVLWFVLAVVDQRAAFGGWRCEIDHITDLAMVGHHHRPLEARDLAGPETGLDR